MAYGSCNHWNGEKKMMDKNKGFTTTKFIRQFAEAVEHGQTNIRFDKEDLKNLEEILVEYVALKVLEEVNCK